MDIVSERRDAQGQRRQREGWNEMDAAGRFRWRRDVQVITAIEFRGEGGGGGCGK